MASLNGNDSEDSQTQQPLKLKIFSKEDLVRFLRVILPAFLRVVDPRESGILDSLYASFLLTETDNESMSGKDVFIRKDQATKLWLFLHKLPVDEFIESVAPELCAKFPHIIPKDFILTDDESTQLKTLAREDPAEDVCIQHAIRRRIRAVTLAGLLYNRECMELEEYKSIICASKEKESSWGIILDKFRNSGDNEQLAQMLQAEMKRHHVRVPHNISDVMSRGFPCTCDGQFPSGLLGSGSDGEKVNSWLSRFPSARSSNSSATRVDASRSGTTISTPRQTDSISLNSDYTLTPQLSGSGSGVAEFEEAASKLETVKLTSSSEDSPPKLGLAKSKTNAEVHIEMDFHHGSEAPVCVADDAVRVSIVNQPAPSVDEVRLCFDNAAFDATDVKGGQENSGANNTFEVVIGQVNKVLSTFGHILNRQRFLNVITLFVFSFCVFQTGINFFSAWHSAVIKNHMLQFELNTNSTLHMLHPDQNVSELLFANIDSEL